MSRYYSTKRIRKENATYNMIIGQRSNGKSYAVKEDSLKLAWKTKKCVFGYVRRNSEDIKGELVHDYFSDMVEDGKIAEITKGEYNDVCYWQSYIYFCKEVDGKKVKSFPIGHAFALSTDQRYKSTHYPHMTEVIFEEFMTDALYLRNEVKRFMHLISTIGRDHKVNVWMIGNTINRVCPYYTEWGLKNVPFMEQGQIDVYEFEEENSEKIKIAVEYCGVDEKKKSGMFFGEFAKNIDGGKWETKEHPHLTNDYEKYNKIYSVSLSHALLHFNIDLLTDGEMLTLFVYPTKDYKRHKRILQETYSENPMITRTLDKRNKAECIIADLFKKKQICFSHNLCGEDFHNVLKNMEICPLTVL